jgi:general secretion pathway protein F
MLALAGAAAVGLLVGVVLPRFALILADVGQALPTSTRIVLDIASAIRHVSLPTAIIAACGLLLLQVAIRTPSGRIRYDRFLLQLPILGALRRTAASSRICGTLAALLGAGVPITSSISHCARACGNAALSRALLTAREDVLHGERLSRALRAHNALTPTAIRLVRAGEESGRLGAMLSHAARLERARSLEQTKSLVRLIEPTLILLTGGVIALVAAALLQALYSMRPVA